MIITALTDVINKKLTDGVYLHGILELENGYDLVSMDEIPEKDGIYECTTILHNEKVSSILYFWKVNNRNRGLVVKRTDENAIKNAEETYNNRSEFI